MLNFGVLALPLPFAIWGFLMGRYHRTMLTWPPTDARRLLAPFLTLLFMMAVFMDFDNLLNVLVYQGGFVILLVLLSSRRIALSSVRRQDNHDQKSRAARLL
jgi:hypothetical protein